MIFEGYLIRRDGRRLRWSEMINAPACIGEQELTGGQSAIPAICKFALQRALVSESCITPVIQLRLR